METSDNSIKTATGKMAIEISVPPLQSALSRSIQAQVTFQHDAERNLAHCKQDFLMRGAELAVQAEMGQGAYLVM